MSVPVGCWTGALIADACREWRAGRVLTAAGVLTAAPVAAAGLSDWADTTGAEQRLGVVHLGANLVATALYATSWWARARGRHRLGVGLGLAGAVSAATGGWMGGHMAYGLGVGVDTNSFDGGPTDWTPVIEGSAETGRVRAAQAAGIGLVLIDTDGGAGPTRERVRVLANRCGHRGGPLADGRLTGDCIQCPWHQSEFDVHSGAVRRGPAVVPQPVYAVRDGDQGLEVRRDEPRSLRVNSVRPKSPRLA